MNFTRKNNKVKIKRVIMRKYLFDFLRKSESTLFGKYLLLTNTVSSGLLMFVGEVAAQKIDRSNKGADWEKVKQLVWDSYKCRRRLNDNELLFRQLLESRKGRFITTLTSGWRDFYLGPLKGQFSRKFYRIRYFVI